MLGNTSLIIIIAVSLLLAIFRRYLIASFRGKKGELNVKLRLQTLPSENYKVINDLLLINNDHTSQIDHVVVSEYGIFVIETKNYMGWIYGGKYNDYWTQNIFGHKYELMNPIIQNQGHVLVLKQLLPDCPPDSFIPIVAFSHRATLKLTTCESVVYLSELNHTIRSYTIRRLPPEMVQQIYVRLLSSNQDSKENRKQHVKNVKTAKMQYKRTVANNHCPYCGGELILKEGRYGQFYGCKNYPRCQYTHHK